MTENQYVSLREVTFKKVYNNTWSKTRLNGEMTLLKEKQEKRLQGYQNLKTTDKLEAERGLILEKYNLELLKLSQSVNKCDLYKKRAQAYLNCIIALSKHQHEDFKKFSDEFVKEIQSQAINSCNDQITMLRQKRVVYSKSNVYLRLLQNVSKKEYEKHKELAFTKEEIDEDSMKQFDIEEDRNAMNQAFQTQEYQLEEKDFYDTSLLDSTPLETINRVYPELKENLLQMNESRAKTVK